MDNDKVLIGSIIFVFGSFILMIVGLMSQSYDNKKAREEALARLNAQETKVVEAVPTVDYSLYKRITGDDGREMVEIPAGQFRMGGTEGDPDEAPEHPVYLDTYLIDLKEVTQGEYQQYVQMTKQGKPFIPVFEDDISKITGVNLPAVGVSWRDAVEYCKWSGKRLPTEAEWEKAARGEARRRYPWGDDFGRARANTDGAEDGFKYLAPPGSFETGRSVYGVYDMTGNVAEWVSDTYDEHYYAKAPYRNPAGPPEAEVKTIRGGSWRETAHGARIAKRFQAKLLRTDASIGFRCARDGESPVKQGKGARAS